MTIHTTSGLDTVTQQNQYANAQPSVNGNIFTTVPYNGSKGNWRLDNIIFHGASITPPPALVSTSFVDFNSHHLHVSVGTAARRSRASSWCSISRSISPPPTSP